MANIGRTSPGAIREEFQVAASALRLVLVEDIDTDAELLRWHLARGGLDVRLHRVQTEPEFRAALHDIRPDVIVSDFSLPQFDGLRALDIASREMPETPFLFVSGTIGEERAIDALRRGATDYVLKSNLSRLGSAVERAVRETSLKTARRRSELQLRASEQQLRATVETSQDWIWEMDVDGRFRFCSNAVASILGYEPMAMIGQDYRSFLHEDDRAEASGLLPVAGQAQLTGAVARWRGADGQVRWLERNVVSIRDDTGLTIGYRGTDRDITGRREQDARLRRLTRSYRMLSSTSSAILRLRNRGELLDEVCRIAVKQGGYDSVVISLIDPGTHSLRQRAWAGPQGESPHVLASVGITETALRTGQPAICNDLSGAEPLAHHEVLVALGYLAVAGLPLQIDGTNIGIVTLFSRQRQVFDDAETAVLLEMTANLGFALQYHDKDEAVQFLSYFDSLTGLAKRPLFCQRLTQMMSSPTDVRPQLVIVFDVQKLSAINDSLGRYIGDRLIENIAARLKEALPDPACLAHFGGGTFAILLTSTGGGDDTGQLSQSALTRHFHEPFIIDGQELRPAIRSGIALFPSDGESADSLVQNAEAALKAAREHNEKYLLYQQVTQRSTTRSLALEARLAGALERDEFVLHYQPKVNIETGRVVGFEALLRWQDAIEGLVPPSLFVPLLERSGAIVDVGEWVLMQAARDLRKWTQTGLGNIRVAVNVSPLQLRRRDFVERVLRSNDPSIKRPAGIDIEITESTLMQDLELSMRKLGELRDAGIGVAIDDFGTGYSSLRLLSRLPVDTLKIDRSFVQNVTDADKGLTLVSTVVTLARAFDMKTVAEGVETIDQLRTLREIDCDQAQGYLFARPGPAGEVPGVIARLAQSEPHGSHNQKSLDGASGTKVIQRQ
jgi:PAS domain S-box-containing protein/diguanylate cyclase (GGDEF)-like protein